MPWSSRCVMGLREEFVGRVRADDSVSFSALCREFGISRKTGYKYVKRYEAAGLAGLIDVPRTPKRSTLATSAEMAVEIVRLRRENPRWGPVKLRAALLRSNKADDVPSARTIDRVLERAGEPRAPRGRKRVRVVREYETVEAAAPNDLWTIDFKGWWRTRDGMKVYPLTVRDQFSRYVLAIELLPRCTSAAVQAVLDDLFRRYGAPKAIRCDNGSPFACTSARGGLSRLSAWWVSLAIRPLFGRPGQPQDNGGHERMHLDVRLDLEDAPAADLPAQREEFVRWRHKFNHDRPHQALDNRVPADLYRPKVKRKPPTARLYTYPAEWVTRRVVNPGRISLDGRYISVSSSLNGYCVGLEPQTPGVYRIWFFDFDLGLVEPEKDGRTRLEWGVADAAK